MRGGNGVLHALGDRDDLAIFALAAVGFVFKHAHNAGELTLFNDGQLDGRDGGAVLFGQGRERLVKVGVLAIHLVDDKHAGQAVLLAQGVGLLAADVQTGHGAQRDQRAVSHGHRADHLAGEIKIAGHVDQIDFGFIKLQRSHGGADGNMPLELFLIVVGRGGSVLHASLTIDRARHIQQRFNQSGFAVGAMADDSDVANIGSGIVFHENLPLLNFALI